MNLSDSNKMAESVSDGDEHPTQHLRLSMLSAQTCPRCCKLIIACTCSSATSNGSLWGMEVIFAAGWDDDDLLPGDDLDIDNCESQPGNDLDTASPMCKKSHQHDEFIPVDDLAPDSLPDDIRHPSAYVWLRNCCPLVVRLVGRNAATGRAQIIDTDRGTTIPCDQVHCPYLSTLGRHHVLHGGIGIITNRHVVTSENEAATTKVEFFYNDDDRRDIVVREFGQRLCVTNRKMDYSMFSCYVHSLDLLKLVENLDRRRQYAWRKIPDTIRYAFKQYAVIISHPHGVSKKVSFGKVIGREMRCRSETERINFNLVRSLYEVCESYGDPNERRKALQRFGQYFSMFPDLPLPYTITWYDTATCKGSSGAPVYMGNIITENGVEINQAHTHRGLDERKGYNNCFT